MNDVNKDTPVKPEISCDGWYAYCPLCGYYDLIPEKHERCPRCEQTIDWDWFYDIGIKNMREQ